MAPKIEVLLLPARLGLKSASWLAGNALERLGLVPMAKLSKKHMRTEAIQRLDSVDYAAKDADPHFLNVSLRQANQIVDTQRLTALRLIAQGVAETYIEDAGKPERQMPSMTEERKLAFKRLLHDHLHEGETLATIGLDEALLPTLQTYHPEFFPSIQMDGEHSAPDS